MIIGYSRVSSDEQAKGMSLANQAARFRELGVEKIFSDVASGYSLRERKGFEDALFTIATGQVKTIVVTHFDRLGRDEVTIFSFFDLCIKHKVTLKSLDHPHIDITDPNGRVLAGYIALEARAYSARLSQRVKQGHQRHRDRNAAYYAPFGYRIKNEKLEPNTTPIVCLLETREERSPWEIAGELVEWYLAGSIRKALTCYHQKYGILRFTDYGTGGYKRRGGLGFNCAGFAAWLVNPILQGHIAYNRSYKGHIKYKGTWDIRPNQHPSLMSPEQYQEIERRLIFNRTTNFFPKSDKVHPYSGLVRCGLCRGKCRSQNYRLRTTGEYRYAYQCNSYRSKVCDHKPYTRVEKIDKAVTIALTKKAEELANWADVPEPEKVDPKILELQSQLNQLRLIPNPSEPIQLAIGGIRKAIDDSLYIRSIESQSDQGIKELLLDAYSDPDYWQSLTPQQQKQIYFRLIERVVIRDGEVIDVVLKL